MTGVMVVQGRELSAEDIRQMQGLLAEHRDWGRTRISEELCRRWDWRNAQGRPKDMAARTPLLKLERSGHIQLPPRQRPSSNEFRNRIVPIVAPRNRANPRRIARPAAFVGERRRAGIG